MLSEEDGPFYIIDKHGQTAIPSSTALSMATIEPRLKCLGYLAPLEALANLPGPNTFAGTTCGEALATANELAVPPCNPVAGRAIDFARTAKSPNPVQPPLQNYFASRLPQIKSIS